MQRLAFLAITRRECALDNTDPVRLLIDTLDDVSGGRVIASDVGWRRE
jgi:hypothetical protein